MGESAGVRTLVFIPAWNEEASLAAVVADVREHLPGRRHPRRRRRLDRRDHGAGARVRRPRRHPALQPGARRGAADRLPHACARATTIFFHALRRLRLLRPPRRRRPAPPAEVARLLAEVEADRADLVIGSRYRDPDAAAGERRLQADLLAADRHQRLPLLPHPGDAPALHRHDQRHAGGEPAGDERCSARTTRPTSPRSSRCSWRCARACGSRRCRCGCWSGPAAAPS